MYKVIFKVEKLLGKVKISYKETLLATFWFSQGELASNFIDAKILAGIFNCYNRENVEHFFLLKQTTKASFEVCTLMNSYQIKKLEQLTKIIKMGL